jgi:PKD repeat protein
MDIMSEGLGQPLDGITLPDDGKRAKLTSPTGKVSPEKRDPHKIVKLVLIAGGTFLVFYTAFALFLLAVLPSPDWGKEGLRLFGNYFFVSVSAFTFSGVGLLAYHVFRSGFLIRKLWLLLRPSIVLIYVLSIAILVVSFINQEPLLPPIDILEPLDRQTLTAPVSITFGTESIRTVLRNRRLFPQRYKWDFDGNGVFDVEKSEQEITTVFPKKGVFPVHLLMLLSDGSVKSAYRRIVIPSAIFSVSSTSPIVNEQIKFDVDSLIDDFGRVDSIFWDFDGDGDADLTTRKATVTHSFSEVGTYHVEVLIQEKSGVQESYVQPLTVLSEPEQPFSVAIESEDPMKGSIPIGITFFAVAEEGVNIRDVLWRVNAPSYLISLGNREYKGERMSHTFSNAGEYLIEVEVTDTLGRTARQNRTITILKPLNVRDVSITGSPNPGNNVVQGPSPLEVRLSPKTGTPFIGFRWEQEGASRVFSVDGNYHGLYNEIGSYPLVLIANDDDERTQKFPLEVIVTPPKSRITFSAIPSTGIAPLDVTFDASQSLIPGKRITGFAWLFGDESLSSRPSLLGAQVSHRYESEGTYRVVVKALTEDGESFEARKTIVVRSPTLDACIFPSRTSGKAPMGIRFDASCSTGYTQSYHWKFGDGTTSEQTEPVHDHVFEEPGTFNVTLEITDGQGNFSEATVVITVLE